ncbi:MAG: mechanosensitive ion channel family protein [Lachnospiraceae bacterium]|nr:mechanosensitive ion channel family protein [Lachnospiraceae bacterium]
MRKGADDLRWKKTVEVYLAGRGARLVRHGINGSIEGSREARNTEGTDGGFSSGGSSCILCYSFLFFVILVRNISAYSENYKARLKPQICRAVIQVARIIPQLEESEKALRDVCDQMNNSWDRIAADDLLDEADYDIPDTRSKLEQFIGETLSWMDRATKLKVGRDGSVVVLDKKTMSVIAHPDQAVLGIRLIPNESLTKENVLDIREISSETRAEDLEAKFNLFELYNPKDEDNWQFPDIDEYLYRSLYGCIIEYEDYYIICGISFYERLSFLFNAFFVTVILFILIWLIIRWISLVMDSRSETVKTMRNKLIAYSLIVCLISFGVSVYFQTLTNVADDLKTMTHHAEVAVETLETYDKQSEKLGSWLDSFYEIQCRLAALMIQKRQMPLDRAAMQMYANYLGVKYVFLFDESGSVVVTNSNYDHVRVGNDPGDPLYEFSVLLEGADCVVLPPAKVERYNEYLQYIGVSIRNEEDLCNGFVMIAVDPALRDELLNALKLEKVLQNLVIGLPDYAVAVDKEKLTISETAGLGYVGENIEELGISQENLEQNFSGFIEVNDMSYYAGVSASEDQYVVPVMRRSSNSGVLSSSLILMLEAACILLLVMILTLFRFQKDVIDAAPSEAYGSNDEEIEIDDDEEVKSEGLFSGIRNRVREKKGFEDRWNVDNRDGSGLTPEKRVKKIVYRLLLLFCLFVLLPTLYISINTDTNIGKLSNLTYVISGKWEKGVNIFAFTSCIFLLCAMYVGAVLVDAILYRIARASDTRVETICLLVKNAIKYICVIIFVYYGLSQFGVNTQTLIASAGILSLMVSLGAKDMVSDILAGFFIIFESAYKVGDFIEVGSWKGTVTEIGLRTTKVKRETNVKIFNNSSMRDIVSSEEISRQTIKIAVSYDADIQEIGRILEKELAEVGPDKIPGLRMGPKYEGISSFEDSSILLQIAIYVESSMRFPALRALNREVKLIFDRNGIEIPFNQIVVHEAQGGAEDIPGEETQQALEEVRETTE